MIMQDLMFRSAKATNTRMMGVVGLICEWEDKLNNRITQIFHLDYESYGIDGFYHFVNGAEREISQTVLGVAGGLGGEFVDISYDEFIFLIKSSYIIDPLSVETLVDFEYFNEYFDDLFAELTLEEECTLYQRLCPEIESAEELLNYFIMRVVGNDYPSTMLLWADGYMDESFEIADQSYSLLKNTVVLLNQTENHAQYRCEALIDFEDHYKLVVVHTSIDPRTLKILSAEIFESMEISSIEASFNLNKPEHMLILTVEDAFFERRFCEQNPEMMKYDYYNGRLYTEFNPDNKHVKENPYFLNGDLYALYFFTNKGQMIVGSLLEDNLDEIDSAFSESGVFEESLSFVCQVKTDHPVLYAFMNSAYENIFDFFENWRQ